MQKCTKNLLNYWIKPTKQRIRYRKIQESVKTFFQIGRRAGAIQKLTSSRSSPTTSEYLSSTSLSSVAQRVSDNTDFEERVGEVKKVPIPTDEELNEAIKDLRLELAILENMLKLNVKGREEVVVYMFGLLNFDEFRRTRR